MCSTPEAVKHHGDQKGGVGTCTIVGIYQCVCVYACLYYGSHNINKRTHTYQYMPTTVQVPTPNFMMRMNLCA